MNGQAIKNFVGWSRNSQFLKSSMGSRQPAKVWACNSIAVMEEKSMWRGNCKGATTTIIRFW